MKKNRQAIKKTVAVQRKQLRDALVKLYRLLKSAKRELSEETTGGIRLKEFSIKLIKESFKRINVYFFIRRFFYYYQPNSWEIDIQDLPKLAHLCGSKLDKDELVYLARSTSQVFWISM